MIGYCGLDCVQCEAFIATKNDDNALRAKVAEEWAKLNNAPIKPEHINCTGCQSMGVKTYYCDQLCEIRRCATEKLVSTCADCTNYPCSSLDAIFRSTPQARATLDKLNKGQEMKSVRIPITLSSPHRATNGKLYGAGHAAIVFSNMDTNDQSEWELAVNALLSDGYQILTYDYPEHIDDQSRILEDAVSFIVEAGARQIILVGASRGGVASIKVAARNTNNDSIVGVVALSAPIEYEETIFYYDHELSGIKIPKLLINSENDGGANDTRKMFELFEGQKELLIYPGDAHGTELFHKEGESVITKIRGFAKSAFATQGTLAGQTYAFDKPF